MDSHKRILVIDDSQIASLAISRILGRLGLEVATAFDGQMGYDAVIRAQAQGRPFDLIFMDVQMPLMDGIAATALLRKNGYAGKIVVLTSLEDARDECMKAGADEFALKPLQFGQLLQMVYGNLPLELLSA